MLKHTKPPVIIILLVLFSQFSYSQNNMENKKVLFIGNSLTFYNNMPEMFHKLATANGDNVTVTQATVGGQALRHLVNNEMVKSKIQSDDWDYVVLQSDDIAAFPDMYHTEIETLEHFKTMIHENNASTKIIYTMIWGARDGLTIQELSGEDVYYSYFDYIEKIYQGTIYFGNTMNFMISPAGWAWKSVIEENEEAKYDLFSSDRFHPAPEGSYLRACVLNEVIFQTENTSIPYFSGLDEEKCYYYQEIAHDIVLNNLSLWNINHQVAVKENTFQHLKIYPNPASNYITIEMRIPNSSEFNWMIYQKEFTFV